MLSNTSVTCPSVRDKLGKLSVIPDRGTGLECPFPETRAEGWAGGGLGCWWGNGPPSQRSVRAMRVVARRGTLRYWSQPYGVQQARNLHNARKCDGGIPRAHVLHELLLNVRSSANKGWVRLVPAAAVTPAPRVAITIIGPKAFVAGLVNPL